MSSWNQYLTEKWKVIRTDMQWEDEAYLRSKARREGEEYKPPDVRQAEKEKKRLRARQRQFAEELREYRNNPDEYVECRQDSNTLVRNIDDDDAELSPPGVWVPYIGSQNGVGWENTRTGERKYQLEKPGTNSRPDEPLDIESRWRDPPALSADNPDFEAPLSPSEFREFRDRRD